MLCAEQPSAGCASRGSRCQRAIDAAVAQALAAIEADGGSLAASWGSCRVLLLLAWLTTMWLSLMYSRPGGQHAFSNMAQNACCIIYLKLRDLRRGGGFCLIWCLHMQMGFTRSDLTCSVLLWYKLLGMMSKPCQCQCAAVCKSAAGSSRAVCSAGSQAVGSRAVGHMQGTDRAHVLDLLKLPLWGLLASSAGRRPACGQRVASLQQANRLGTEQV